jgi:hypothetical protein
VSLHSIRRSGCRLNSQSPSVSLGLKWVTAGIMCYSKKRRGSGEGCPPTPLISSPSPYLLRTLARLRCLLEPLPEMPASLRHSGATSGGSSSPTSRRRCGHLSSPFVAPDSRNSTLKSRGGICSSNWVVNSIYS